MYIYCFSTGRVDTVVEHRTDDSAMFDHLAQVYAKTHPSMLRADPPCTTQQLRSEYGVVNGASMRGRGGSMQDWNYDVTGCLELMVYTSCCKYPADLQLAGEWNAHHPSLQAVLLEAHRGLRGQVRDQQGRSVAGVRIHVNDHSSYVLSTDNGTFYKLLLPGNYTLTVSSSGFEPVTEVLNN